MLKKTADAIRFLSMDAVKKANSGHPGAPMALADLMVVLFKNHLKHNPKTPNWINRDRFVLSNGHASMLLYSTLHLAGYGISMDDIKNFRQFNSKTPGHPELNQAIGIETTTGPLGQGLANAVGMALAEKTLAAQFNQNHFDVINHHSYVLVGDGCLMEGVSHEASSLAGVLELDKLIVFWDDNGISIDGKLATWQNENVCARYQAYGFEVIEAIDGHNHSAIDQAITKAKKSNKPSFIQIKTKMAYGSELEDNPKAHGSPLNEEQISNARKNLNWQWGAFDIPNDVYDFFNHSQKGDELENQYNHIFNQYRNEFPNQANELLRRINGDLPVDFENKCNEIIYSQIKAQHEELKVDGSIKPVASRSSSQKALSCFADFIPELFGGSADLTPSNLTFHSQSVSINQDKKGNYCNYGVREFAMAAMMNGIYLHGGFLPYGGTFLVFSDYARGAIRLASLMKTKVIYVFTHDSIGVGEDGPTHQPIEQLASLRLIPNLRVWRPCNLIETFVAYKKAISYQGPTLLALSRQNLEQFLYSYEQINQIEKGGYVICEPNLKKKQKLDGLIIATGSEVSIAINLAKKYNSEGIFIRVVSMPCVNEFCKQESSYQQSVLPKKIKNRLVIEASVSTGWEKFAKDKGEIIAIDNYGKSAPAGEVFNHFGLNSDLIYQKYRNFFTN